jgi:uncharacterized protein (TIGR03663 family)
MKWERWIFVGALAAGALLRLPLLDMRPMHTDEAVHAVKFGTLLESGVYRYDKNEYHGPTLNYLTLVPAWLSGARNLSETTETTLRIVPVMFGISLLLFLLLFKDLDRKTVATAALLTACSPAMVFYSRYYIQEMLLVWFSFGLIVAGYRLITGGRAIWAVAAGVCVGFMHATKETWIISVGAMGIALFTTLLICHPEGQPKGFLTYRHLLLALVSGVVVSVTLYSSFFTHWQGVADSLVTYKTYFERAAESSRHGHPWYYFLQVLGWWKSGEGPVWTEGGILVLALIGMVDSLKKTNGREPGERRLIIFFGLYALLMFVILSALPYKTPWLIVSALQPLIVVAGAGMAAVMEWLKERQTLRWGILAVYALVAHLAWQAYLGNYKYYDDPTNPYVYSHPTGDVKLVAQAVLEAAKKSPEKMSMPVQVVYPDDEYWPLPWYLRSLRNIGWWRTITDDFVPTPVILISPEVEPALVEKLFKRPAAGPIPLYVSLFEKPLYVRPGKEIRGYVTLDLMNER